MKAAILARVSTEKQAQDGRASLDNQLELLRAMALRNNWEVVAEFVIPGESAYVDSIAARPQFEAAMRAARRQEFDILLISEFSRFARNKLVAETALKDLREAGVALIAANGTNYTRNDDMASIDGWVAQRASADHAVRVRRGLEAMFRRGLPVGDVPFGYRRQMMTDSRGATVPNTGVPPVVVEAEAEAIRWAYHWYIRNGSLEEIAREFQRRGLRPRSKRNHEYFETSAIQHILENQFYAGTVSMYVREEDELGRERRRLETIEGLHVPIVSMDEWMAAQNRKRARERSRRVPRLLAGVIRCHDCKNLLTGSESSKQAPRYRDRKRANAPCKNSNRGIAAFVPDTQVEACMAALMTDHAFIAAVNAADRATVRTGAGSERAAIERERQRVTSMYRKGYLTEREVDQAMRELRGREMALGADIVDLRGCVAKMTSWGETWEQMLTEERNEVVKEVLEAVFYDWESSTVGLRPRDEYRRLFVARAHYASTYDALKVPGTPDRSRALFGPDGVWTPGELGIAA